MDENEEIKFKIKQMRLKRKTIMTYSLQYVY